MISFTDEVVNYIFSFQKESNRQHLYSVSCLAATRTSCSPEATCVSCIFLVCEDFGLWYSHSLSGIIRVWCE